MALNALNNSQSDPYLPWLWPFFLLAGAAGEDAVTTALASLQERANFMTLPHTEQLGFIILGVYLRSAEFLVWRDMVVRTVSEKPPSKSIASVPGSAISCLSTGSPQRTCPWPAQSFVSFGRQMGQAIVRLFYLRKRLPARERPGWRFSCTHSLHSCIHWTMVARFRPITSGRTEMWQNQGLRTSWHCQPSFWMGHWRRCFWRLPLERCRPRHGKLMLTST